MIFNSDDGFLVSETHGAGDSRGSTLGVFNGGRGASDTTFGFAVAEPGVYPIRAIWYEGGGGANLEWSSIVDGERVLINDTSAGGLKAYRSRSGNPVNLDSQPFFLWQVPLRPVLVWMAATGNQALRQSITSLTAEETKISDLNSSRHVLPVYSRLLV